METTSELQNCLRAGGCRVGGRCVWRFAKPEEAFIHLTPDDELEFGAHEHRPSESQPDDEPPRWVRSSCSAYRNDGVATDLHRCGLFPGRKLQAA